MTLLVTTLLLAVFIVNGSLANPKRRSASYGSTDEDLPGRESHAINTAGAGRPGTAEQTRARDGIAYEQPGYDGTGQQVAGSDDAGRRPWVNSQVNTWDQASAGSIKADTWGNVPKEDTSKIPGVAGRDYPIYSAIPQTRFSCSQQNWEGMYADVQAKCQVFHVCGPRGKQDSFLCPTGTVFHQKYFTCDWWYNVACADSPSYYYLNDEVHKEAKQAAASNSLSPNPAASSWSQSVAPAYGQGPIVNLHGPTASESSSGSSYNPKSGNPSYSASSTHSQSKPPRPSYQPYEYSMPYQASSDAVYSPYESSSSYGYQSASKQPVSGSNNVQGPSHGASGPIAAPSYSASGPRGPQHIAQGPVGPQHIAQGPVGPQHIAQGPVGPQHIAQGPVGPTYNVTGPVGPTFIATLPVAPTFIATPPVGPTFIATLPVAPTFIAQSPQQPKFNVQEPSGPKYNARTPTVPTHTSSGGQGPSHSGGGGHGGKGGYGSSSATSAVSRPSGYGGSGHFWTRPNNSGSSEEAPVRVSASSDYDYQEPSAGSSYGR